MNKNNIKIILSVALAVAVFAILINSFIYNSTAWHVVNVLYISIPVLFIFFCARKKGDLLVALILWVPALIVGYMAYMGFLGISHPIWTALNMWQLIAYSYFIGTRFNILPQ